MRDERLRLQDILWAITQIERYVLQGRAMFDRDELVQTWVVHHLQIIGEAASKVTDGLQELHPEIPWPQIIAMRNILVHGYFGLDLEEVWSAVERDLPDLKRKVEGILRQLSE